MQCTLERSFFVHCNAATTFKHPNVQAQVQLPNEDKQAYQRSIREE